MTINFRLIVVSFVWMIAITTILSLSLFSDKILEAAQRGVAIWWQVLLPALFPFFVLAELLIGLGIVHFIGKLLDPFMRPLFRLPGSAAFVVVIGFASGYPVSAKLTAHLWEQKMVTREEGERLVAFATTADPIFISSAIAVGFFGNAHIAPLLMVAHYGSALLIGLVTARWSKIHRTPTHNRPTINPVKGAFIAMHEARLLDGRRLTQLVADAIASALRLIIVVGGLVVCFAVFIEFLHTIEILDVCEHMLSRLFAAVQLPPQLASAITNGMFEVTLGAQAAGQNTGTHFMHAVAVAAFVISWTGFSVHAQISSLLSRTDMRYRPFLISRFCHGIIALIFVYLGWPFFME